MNAAQRSLAHKGKQGPQSPRYKLDPDIAVPLPPASHILQCPHAIDPSCLHLGFRIVRMDRSTNPRILWPSEKPISYLGLSLTSSTSLWSCRGLLSGMRADNSGKKTTTPCNFQACHCCAEFTLLAFHGDYCKLLSPQFSSLSPGSALLCCYFSSSNRSFCLQSLHSGKDLSLSIILSNLSRSASLLFFFLNAHISSTIETPSLAVTPLTQKPFLAASSPTGIDVTSCVTWAITYNLLALGSSYL